jgi:hypothetical protein
MVGSLVFTLLVAAGEGDSPATQAILRALTESLGLGVTAVAREVQGAQTDEAALAIEDQTGSAAVAVVSWVGAPRLEARVRVHLHDTDRWLTRGLTFLPSDDLRERGRTLGFTLASMLPDRRPTPRAETSPAAPRPPPIVITLPPPAPPPSRWALDALVAGSLGVNGDADGIGGAFAVRRTLVPALAVRLEVSGRTGVLQVAQATAISLHAGLGLCWNPLGNPATHRADLGLRADLGAFFESLSHLSPDDAERVRQARFLPGGDLMLEGSVRVFDSAALVLGLGGELAFGRTDVYVHEAHVSVIPPLRLVTNLGLRQYF